MNIYCELSIAILKLEKSFRKKDLWEILENYKNGKISIDGATYAIGNGDFVYNGQNINVEY